jgi:hypothetical protein
MSDSPEGQRDFYVIVRELISRLEEGQQHAWAIAHGNATTVSNIRSEVIGEIGVTLRELVKTTIPKELKIEGDIDECRKWIRTVWPDL